MNESFLTRVRSLQKRTRNTLENEMEKYSKRQGLDVIRNIKTPTVGLCAYLLNLMEDENYSVVLKNSSRLAVIYQIRL